MYNYVLDVKSIDCQWVGAEACRQSGNAGTWKLEREREREKKKWECWWGYPIPGGHSAVSPLTDFVLTFAFLTHANALESGGGG